MISNLVLFNTRSRKEQVGTAIGIVASILGIILWAILAYANPYSKDGITDVSVKITVVRLGLPAIGGLVASVLGQGWLMCIVLVGSLPFYIYMAGTPGTFKLFGLVLIGFILSMILIIIGWTKTFCLKIQGN